MLDLDLEGYKQIADALEVTERSVLRYRAVLPITLLGPSGQARVAANRAQIIAAWASRATNMRLLELLERAEALRLAGRARRAPVADARQLRLVA